jgi:signal transduction histidine kinase
VYRVAQEALTNVAKHGQPERVELRLAYEPAAIRLTIEDFGRPDRDRDGVAIGRAGARVAASASASAGYGLTGMRERAELLGGTLTTEATASGFRVELTVPVGHQTDVPTSEAPDVRPANTRELVR